MNLFREVVLELTKVPEDKLGEILGFIKGVNTVAKTSTHYLDTRPFKETKPVIETVYKEEVHTKKLNLNASMSYVNKLDPTVRIWFFKIMKENNLNLYHSMQGIVKKSSKNTTCMEAYKQYMSKNSVEKRPFLYEDEDMTWKMFQYVWYKLR